MDKPIAIIPARGGSQRIPGKNRKLFFGKPIIEYSIAAAQASKLFGEVVVSTDSDEIAAIAFNAGAVPYRRPAEFCLDDVGTQAVAAQYLRLLTHRPMLACVIYATAPLMRVEDLREGYHMMLRRDCHFVLGVQASPLQDAGQFYWCWVPGLLRGDPLIDTRTGLIPLPDGHVCDINTPEDWARAEKLFSQLMESER